MMTCFITIQGLTETPEGLLVRQTDGTTSLLRREHKQFAWMTGLLASAVRRSVPWPVRILRTDDGEIADAWVASPGRPIGFNPDPSGDCAFAFSLTPSLKVLKHDHPEYERLLALLLEACGLKRDVFFAEVPGQPNILADAVLAP